MAEITRVPLQPIRKGSLTKLWLGVLVALLLAGGVAWAAMPASTKVTEITAGVGAEPVETDWVLINYTGKLPDGKVFDQAKMAGLHLAPGEVIPGFIEGLTQMKKGGKYELWIPADKAYGASPPPGAPIPPNTDLTFEVELLDFMSNADYEQRVAQQQQMMQQLQQMQGQGRPGGPGGPGAPAGPPVQ